MILDSSYALRWNCMIIVLAGLFRGSLRHQRPNLATCISDDLWQGFLYYEYANGVVLRL